MRPQPRRSRTGSPAVISLRNHGRHAAGLPAVAAPADAAGVLFSASIKYKYVPDGTCGGADMRELDSRTGIFTTRNGVREEIRIERADYRLLDIYGSWTPARRLKAVADMMRAAREVMTAGVRQQHPDWTDAEVKREVARRYGGYGD
jgi:hypothetical protein